ncbi:MAG: sugar isomerase domain-containing protein [Propionibacteriaceae bacterium]|nr:sugar isomerase domain-containing protein [Propionibacteriaceae bacterium]
MYETYLEAVQALPGRIQSANRDVLPVVAEVCATSIAANRAVFVFGSGHSILPCMDLFPRYGGYTGYVPMMDPRLMWTTVSGPGGAEEVLWQERSEGYAATYVVNHYPIKAADTVVVLSHGGRNAAPVEVALAGKERGATVVALTSGEGAKTSTPLHSSGQRLVDIADYVLDNGVDAEDSQVAVPGVPFKVGGLSTIGAMVVLHALSVEVAGLLAARGLEVLPFVSPNAPGVPEGHSAHVYDIYKAFVRGL